MEDSRKPLPYLDSEISFIQSEKTIFVIDGAPYFTHVASGHSCHADHLREPKKTGKVGINPIDPVPKSISTCSIEAIVEYSRIVWDLFPRGKCAIALMMSCPELGVGFAEKIINWNKDQQNLNYLMRSLAMINQKRPKPTKLATIQNISTYPNSNGHDLLLILEKSLEKMSELTHDQKKSPTKANNGRIILITSLQNQNCLDQLIQKFTIMLDAKRKQIKRDLDKQPANATDLSVHSIDHLELLVINTFPINDQGPTGQIIDRQRTISPTSPMTTLHVRSVPSGRDIAGVLSNLCLQHYRLRSTTITGIPMKEEQNASSSSNYDVELMHCSSAHDSLAAMTTPSMLEGVINLKHRHGYPYESYTLRWCTPRFNNVELFHCTNTSRITSVDVNSRPSSCLTNFLLNGRAVMLEIYKSKNCRMTSHMLASHSGELYIHTLATNKLNLEDCLSIVECTGGRVTNYRINEFIALTKKHTLKPCRSIISIQSGVNQKRPIDKAIEMIERSTLYWPIVSSHSIMYNLLNKLARFVELVPKSHLSTSEVLECKKSIFDIVSMETDFATIPPPSVDGVKSPTGSKSQKIDHNYKLLWNELEHFVRVNCSTPDHELVLECLLECRSSDDKKSTDGKKQQMIKNQNTVVKTIINKGKRLEGPQSPPSSKRSKNDVIVEPPPQNIDSEILVNFKSGMSLLQTWMTLRAINRRPKGARAEFAGRLTGSNICPLYTHLEAQQQQQQNTPNNANWQEKSVR